MTPLDLSAIRAALTDVDAEFARLFDELDGLADTFATIVQKARAKGEPSTEDTAGLRHASCAVLDAHAPLVTGAGVIAAPGLLSDAAYWLDWWWRTPMGGYELLRVNLDPRSPDFFDYPNADWFSETARKRSHHVAGPYVDYACTNAYSLTVSTPVLYDGDVLGVAAADVLVSSLEQRVAPALCKSNEPIALANGDGRIIAANSTRWLPGLLIPADAASAPAFLPTGDASPFQHWLIVHE